MTPAPKLVECSTVDDLTNIVFKEIYNPLSSNGHLSQQQQVRLHGWKLAAEVYLRLALPWIGVPCENYHKTGRYYFAASERKAVRDELKYLSRQVAKKSITSPEQLVSSSRHVLARQRGLLTSSPLAPDSLCSELPVTIVVNPSCLYSPTVSFSCVHLISVRCIEMLYSASTRDQAKIELLILKHCLIWVRSIRRTHDTQDCARRWEVNSPGSEFERLEQAVLKTWVEIGPTAQLDLCHELQTLRQIFPEGLSSRNGQDELRREKLKRILEDNEAFYELVQILFLLNRE